MNIYMDKETKIMLLQQRIHMLTQKGEEKNRKLINKATRQLRNLTKE